MSDPEKGFGSTLFQSGASDDGICLRVPRCPRLAGLLTHEDVDRARDRWRVGGLDGKDAERRDLEGFRVLWLLVGPGVLVFLGENDAPSMLSYSATGARFGIGFFIPFVVLTFLMGLVVQEMTVRLGAVTHRGHAELIFDRFGKFWGFFSMGDLVLGNFLTLVTEFIGIRAGLGFFGIRPVIAVGGSLGCRDGRDCHRTILDLGTNHAGPGDLQRSLHSGRHPGASGLVTP